MMTASGMEISMDLGASVDPEQERKRLQGRIAEVDSEIKRAEAKLANASFVAKAPQAVVDKERAKLDEHRNNRAKLEKQLAGLGS